LNQTHAAISEIGLVFQFSVHSVQLRSFWTEARNRAPSHRYFSSEHKVIRQFAVVISWRGLPDLD
jgi:hypothetical protein